MTDETTPAPGAATAEVYETADLVCGLVAGVESYLAETKAGSSSMVAALTEIAKLQALIGPGISGVSKIPAELAAMSEDDLLAFGAHVIGKLAITDSGTVDKVTKALQFVASSYSLYKAVTAKPAPAAA